MKAIVYTQYGSPDALQLKEVATPAPKDDEVLIAVRATGLNAADRYLLRGRPAIVRLYGGLRRPKHPILGSDVAGEVVAVGRAVTAFRPGDAVYGDLSGIGRGGLAEFVAAPAGLLARVPAGLSFVEAAATPMPGVTALQGLRDTGQLQSGQQVLIAGASGGVGTFAVQIARALGGEVTAVCSPRNAEQARALGASRVIDYTRQDFAAEGARYDLVVAVNGRRSIGDYRRVLRPGGAFVALGGDMRQILPVVILGPLLSTHDKKVRALSAKPDAADLAALGELMAAGQVRPVVERCYPLSETAAAFRHLERVQGKIVIGFA